MDKPVIIFGAKGIAHAALEIFESNSVVVYGFLDDDKTLHGTDINNIPILGDTEDHGYLKLIGVKCEAFVASDENKIRKEMVNYLIDKRKVMPTNAVHQTAVIAKSCSIGHGNFINAGVIIGSNVEIGQHCIIHSGVIIESGSKLEDLVQIGAGTIINSNVTIEMGTFIGSGVNIVSGITIGKDARIGAGSVVVANVKKGETVFGNPAKAIN